MGKTIVNEIEKCTQCPHCTILPDPEPYDWFCDDDVKLFCEKLKRTVAAALRPYESDESCHFQTVHAKNIEQSGIKNIIIRNMNETLEQQIKRLEFCRDCIDQSYKAGRDEYNRLERMIEELKEKQK